MTVRDSSILVDRAYENLRPTILNPNFRGLATEGIPGTQYVRGACDATLFKSTAKTKLENNVQLCTGMEWVVLKYFVPEKRVSGSEVLFGPVGFIAVKDALFGSSMFAGQHTTVDIVRDFTGPLGAHLHPPLVPLECFNAIGSYFVAAEDNN